jgi:hypothetical protein
MALGSIRGKGAIRAVGRTLDYVVEPSDSEVGSFPVVPLQEMLEFARTERIALLKVDIEGSEKEAFQTVPPPLFRRIDRIIVEYHDNLVSGSLAAVRKALGPTHEVYIEPSSVSGCGLIRAIAR